jgi:hypothetical protein
MNTLNPRFYLSTLSGRSSLNGIDLAAVLEADNNFLFLTLVPGIDREIAEKFHCSEAWDELDEYCREQKTFVFRTLYEVNAMAAPLFFPQKIYHVSAGTVYGD